MDEPEDLVPVGETSFVGEGESVPVKLLKAGSTKSIRITLKPRASGPEVCFAAGHSGPLDQPRCANCTDWDYGSLNLSSRAQPFIFATGSGGKIGRTSLSKSTPQHDYYESFTLDLIPASSSRFVNTPRDFTVNSGAAISGAVASDHDSGLIMDALVMGLALRLLMPLGVFLLHVLETVRCHGWDQAIATLLVIVELGTGIYTSRGYNKAGENRAQAFGLLVA